MSLTRGESLLFEEQRKLVRHRDVVQIGKHKMRVAEEPGIRQMQHARVAALLAKRVNEHAGSHDLRAPSVSDKIGNRLLVPRAALERLLTEAQGAEA